MPTTDFSDTFLDDTVKVISSIDRGDIEAVASVMRTTRDRGGRLFFCGSGGGAGHASHATCDFRKLGGFEAYSVTDNVSELTARTNDEGWNTSYSAWLASSRLSANDCLFVFSVGGGSIEPPVSVNLVNAIQTAQQVGADVVGVVGRDGGYLRSTATASILIPTGDASFTTPQAEGLQAVMWHLLVSHPLLYASTAKWEGIDAGLAK
ncbi:MAG: SIS domain-containing protein [Ilumatobacteraceae bacterium]